VRMQEYEKNAPPQPWPRRKMRWPRPGLVPGRYHASGVGLVYGIHWRRNRHGASSKDWVEATVERTHVGFMGCTAPSTAEGGAGCVEAELDARVLVCAVELCTLHFFHRLGRRENRR